MSLETTTTAKIRFIDCDPIGHLNNSIYLDYMLNAREDHVEDYYGFTYQEIIKQTGCTWVTVQNEIAYLREVRYNDIVEIVMPDILIEDDCKSIGGQSQMCITYVAPSLKSKIKSIVVKMVLKNLKFLMFQIVFLN